MKHLRLPLFAVALLLATACGSKTEQPAGKPGANSVMERDPNLVQQIPAKEILGSTVERHVRYQPKAEVDQYISPADMDKWLTDLSNEMRKAVGRLAEEVPTYGTVVVGLNAAGETSLWYVFPQLAPSTAMKGAFEEAVRQAPKPKVNRDLVVVGLAMTFWGYKETPEQAGVVKLPAEWEAITAKSGPAKATELARKTWNSGV